MRILFTFILTCLSVFVFAQTRGKVTVEKDPLIDTLIARRIQLQRAASQPAASRGVGRPAGPIISVMGYRVQIYYGSDRRKMYSEQAQFKSEYPKMNTYITYKEPNYYLRVGDFRTRLEAQRFMNELRATYPTLFIFREKINAQNLEYSNGN